MSVSLPRQIAKLLNLAHEFITLEKVQYGWLADVALNSFTFFLVYSRVNVCHSQKDIEINKTIVYCTVNTLS